MVMLQQNMENHESDSIHTKKKLK